IEAEAVQLDEAAYSVSGETNLTTPGQANVGVYSFRSPLWRLPLEVLQDVEAIGGAMEVFKKFAADRIARGVGKKLINGNGSGTILGLIPYLAGLRVILSSVLCSSGNTGGADNGTNSHRHQDRPHM